MNSCLKYFSACLLALLSQAAFAQTTLGTASSFALLGATTVTCTGAGAVTGDVGVWPGTAITGFDPDCTLTGTIHAGDAVAEQAQSDAAIAYAALKDLTCLTDLTGQDLGGLTLAPGVYCFDSSAQLTGILNLTGGGPWIFQIGSTLTTETGSSVLVNSGADCDGLDVFWQVGSSATLGTGTQFIGNILAFASVGLDPSATLAGRALALNAAVTLSGQNTVSVCGSGGATGPGGGKSQSKCNQGVGNGPEGCDPGNSNQGYPFRSNDELGGTPGNPGRKGGNK